MAPSLRPDRLKRDKNVARLPHTYGRTDLESPAVVGRALADERSSQPRAIGSRPADR